MKRSGRPAVSSPTLSRRLNMPSRTDPNLKVAYIKAFTSWDQALRRSIAGYADIYKKRRWFISASNMVYQGKEA